jgi:hypothetical protein
MNQFDREQIVNSWLSVFGSLIIKSADLYNIAEYLPIAFLINYISGDNFMCAIKALFHYLSFEQPNIKMSQLLKYQQIAMTDDAIAMLYLLNKGSKNLFFFKCDWVDHKHISVHVKEVTYFLNPRATKENLFFC